MEFVFEIRIRRHIIYGGGTTERTGRGCKRKEKTKVVCYIARHVESVLPTHGNLPHKWASPTPLVTPQLSCLEAPRQAEISRRIILGFPAITLVEVD